MTTLKHTKSGKPILSLEELERGRKKETPEGARYECPLQDCPSIGKYGDVRKLYVNDRTGLWFCHYCKQGGQLKEYWALPTDSSIATRLNVAIAAVERERVTAQREQEKIAEAQSYFAQTIPLAGTASEKYLQSRGIDPDLAEKAGVRHANRWGQSIKWGGAPAVVFPGHNFHGQLVVTEGRYHRSQGDSMKAQSRGEKHLGVFHTPGAFEQRHIVIAEGPISALSLGMATIPAIAHVRFSSSTVAAGTHGWQGPCRRIR